MDRLNKLIKEYLVNPTITENFKVGDPITYLGHPAEITKVKTDIQDRTWYSVSYDKGNGKTKVSNILSTANSIKSLNESKKSCSCGCGTCGEGVGPRLNENFKGKLHSTDIFKVHLKNSIPLTESKYPKNSKEYKNLITEARYLYSRKVIDLNEKDVKLIKESESIISKDIYGKNFNKELWDDIKEKVIFDLGYDSSDLEDYNGEDEVLELTNKLYEKHILDSKFLKELKNSEGFKLQGMLPFQGLNIMIENKKGSTRSGEDPKGKKWEVTMKNHYGYISKTLAADDEHVDCYVGNNKKSDKVFVVHQVVPETGEYDEDKVMLGFNSGEEAKTAYLDHYDSPDFFGEMTEMTMDRFKQSLKDNKGQKLKENKKIK